MAEEEYEVEKILGHHITKKGKVWEITYHIKWLGYGEADNTWEKERNVFATDMIVNYWNTFPKTSSERQLFEKIQATKKNPILLSDKEQVHIPTVSSSSSTLFPPIAKKQLNLTDVFKPVEEQGDPTGILKGKEKEGAFRIDIEPKRLPTVIANNNDSADELDEDDEDKLMEDAKSDSDFNMKSVYGSSAGSLDKEEQNESSSDEVQQIQDSSEEEDVVEITSKKPKRKRAAYSDYFLEQHEKKKKTENGSDSDDTESVVSIKEKENNEDHDNDSIIFDEYFGTDPPMDWENLAEKVIFIGQEVPESPLYCVIKWKDGVKSVHPLSLVRDKRPDLVIDCFVSMLKK